jgi:hypothetical protein
VDSWCEAIVLGNALQQGAKLGRVRSAESGEQIGFLLVGKAFGTPHHVTCLGCEVHGVGAPVRGVRATFD